MMGTGTPRRARRRAAAGLAATLLAALLAPAATAAPRDVTVVQEGPSLRVSWTPDAADDAHGVEISNSPDFPRFSPNTCFTFLLRGRTTLLRCLIPFGATVFVRVSPTAGTATTIELPSSRFAFAPIPAPAPLGAIRNRQQVGCRVTTADFANIDGGTTFTGRITVAGEERVAADFPNPLSGDAPIFAKERIAYALRGADVGRQVRCEITATQGTYSATRAIGSLVGHARPAEKRPLRMLIEALRPSDWYEATGTTPRLGRLARRAGALRRARLHVATIDIARTLRLDATLTTFATAREAARDLGAHVCRELRRRYVGAQPAGQVRGVASCRAVRVRGASRAYAAVTYGLARRDDGVPIIVVQAITIASVGTTSVSFAATAGDTYARRRSVFARAQRTGDAYAARLVTAAVRE